MLEKRSVELNSATILCLTILFINLVTFSLVGFQFFKYSKLSRCSYKKYEKSDCTENSTFSEKLTNHSNHIEQTHWIQCQILKPACEFLTLSVNITILMFLKPRYTYFVYRDPVFSSECLLEFDTCSTPLSHYSQF